MKKKNRIWSYLLVIMGFVVFHSSGCKKEVTYSPIDAIGWPKGLKGKIVLATSYNGSFARIYSFDSNGRKCLRGKSSLQSMGGIKWSPDGSTIVYSGSQENTVWENGISIMNANGTNNKLILSSNFLFNFEHLDWSPDDKKIAFTRTQGTEFGIICIINADGSGLTELTDGGFPNWSSDGNNIIFAKDSFDSYGVVFKSINLSNHSIAILFTDSRCDDISLSPDGTKILYTSSPTYDASNIYVTNIDGSGTKQLTHYEGWCEFTFSPCWSTDGTKITFGKTSDGKKNFLCVMNSDGSNIVKVSEFADECPQFIDWN